MESFHYKLPYSKLQICLYNIQKQGMHPASIVFFLIIITLTTSLQLCSSTSNTNCLPCSRECNTCSQPSTCNTCSKQYYLSNNTTCSTCSQNCLVCDSTGCATCSNPYILVNKTCTLCVISNALSCSSTVAASSCQSGYYLNSGICDSCMLNCITCSSAYDCSTCASGYYLNVSIITCNPCPMGCSSCNQYTSSICTGCNNGYQLSSQSCIAVTCGVSNCLYCSSPGICQQCSSFYYWNGSICVGGASVTCEYGSNGPLPNNCINKCSNFAYLSNNISNTFLCKLYTNIYISRVEYKQIYYYAYNHQTMLNSLTSTTTSLNLQSNGQYSYPIQGTLTLVSVPNYYKAVIRIKYVSQNPITLNLTATTPTDTQIQTLNFSASTSPNAVELQTSIVHSYNLMITPNSSFNLIELYIRYSKCSSGCTVCLNQQLCQLCNSPYYMLSYSCVANCSVYIHYMPNMTCLTTCPSGFHEITNSGLKYCQTCVSPCLTCTNSTVCLSCVSTYFYYNYTCSKTCPSSYYAESTSRQCKPCISPCSTCTNQTTCLSCSQGFWNGSSCANSCPNGYFGDSKNFICSLCSSSCLTCIKSASTCTSCTSTLIYYNYQCLSSCPNRYYNSNGQCLQCVPPCYTCNSSSTCLSCSYNYLYNNTCIQNCPSGFYTDLASSTCLACQSQCLTCSSSFSCTSCKSGCLYSGSCPASCPTSSFYPQSVNSSCSCVQCIYPCSTCSNSTSCLSCVDGFLYSGSCLITCPDSYYANSVTATCTLCSSTFSNCMNCSSTACTLCNSSFYLSNEACLSSCPNGYYTSSQQCILCVAPCKTCTDASKCLSCITPYSLSGTTCVLQCSTNQVSLNVSNILQCLACSSPCLSCSVTQTNCTYCLYGYYLYNYKCLSNCSTITPTNTYYSQSSTLSCETCSFPCSTCQSQTKCLSCKVGYWNPSSYTCTQCSLRTYAVNSTCVSCPSSCSICYSSSYCTSCTSAYYLYQNTCINDTSICKSNGYYVAGNICYACLQPCSTCWVTASNCSSCLSGYIFASPNNCLITCSAGFYRSGNQCLACSSVCATCVTGPDYCLTCASNYYLLLSNSSCLSSCPDGTFLSGSACSICQYPCKTCTSQLTCLSCITGVLIGSQCYSSCLSGYYATNNNCQPCTSPCAECSMTATNCTQCITNYWLLNNTCIATCPSKYFSQSQSRQCLTCVGLCKQCSSYINCTACNSTYIYFFSTTNQVGQCIISCPASYYLINNTCTKCLSTCLTCSNGTTCLTCSGILVQYNGQCLSTCPSQMYSLGGICTNCSFPCINCTDAYTCTSCPTDYLLVASSSCVPGPTCPSGYYLQADAPKCVSKCPSGFYNLRNGTCNNISCGSYFMGADMFCYSTCPTGYMANSSYYCESCTSCGGLYFSLTYSIIKDSLYLYLSFTEIPNYSFTPQITLSPALPYQSINFQDTLIAGSGFTGSKNITFLLKLNSSLTATYLTLTFQNQLATFTNPLQVPNATIYIQGYDYYPTDLSNLSSFGALVLIVALVGLLKNPYMLDFAQTLYLVGLVNCHFPSNFASFLQSMSISHLHGWISVDQPNQLGTGKFLYLTGTGFLTNTLTNLVIIMILLSLSLIVFLVYIFLKRKWSYSKVHEQSHQEQLHQAKQQYPCFLRNLSQFFQNYKIKCFNRIIYFNYSILTLFALVQLANFDTSATINTLSCVLALLTLLLLIYYPATLRQIKPKYTFLYARKLLISGAVVLSLKDAIYAVGIISVCNFTTAVLIMTYKMEKYRYQSRFLAACQVAQLFTNILLSFFIIIGEGNYTNSKLTICKIIIALIVIILFCYLLQACSQIFFYFYLKIKGVDLRQNCKLNSEQEEQQSHHSQSINGSVKDKIQKQQKVQPQQPKLENLQTFLVQIRSQIIKDKLQNELQKQTFTSSLQHKQQQKQTFWAYNQSQKDENQAKQQKQPPKMLVRCLNEFSDIEGGSQSNT